MVSDEKKAQPWEALASPFLPSAQHWRDFPEGQGVTCQEPTDLLREDGGGLHLVGRRGGRVCGRRAAVKAWCRGRRTDGKARRRHLYLCRHSRRCRGAEPQGGAALRKWRARGRGAPRTEAGAGGVEEGGDGETPVRGAHAVPTGALKEKDRRRHTRQGPSGAALDLPPKQKTKRDSREPCLLETSHPKH